MFVIGNHGMENDGSGILESLIREKVEYIDSPDDKMDFLVSACDVDTIEMPEYKPVFSAEYMRDKESLRTVIEQLNISKKMR